jgi:hypothetical protein
VKTQKQIQDELKKISIHLILPSDKESVNELNVAFWRGALHACNWVLNSHCQCCGKRFDETTDDEDTQMKL